MQIGSKKIDFLKSYSTSLDSTGKGYYKDSLTLPIHEFNYTTRPVAYKLSEAEVYRFDLLILSFYEQVDYYLDMILWLNHIGFLTDETIGQTLYFPTKQDLDLFYKTYFVESL